MKDGLSEATQKDRLFRRNVHTARKEAVNAAIIEFRENEDDKAVSCPGCHFVINRTPDDLIIKNCIGFKDRTGIKKHGVGCILVDR